MLRTRLQALWMQNTRNRIMIMVSTAVLTILLLCGCLNLLGVMGGGLVNSLIASGPPVRPTLDIGTQVANINPTFPLPTPTVFGYPTPPAQNVPSSGTPPPTPTPSPTPVVTDTPPPDNGPLQYEIQPDRRAFRAGQTNQIVFVGQPGMVINVSIILVSYTACIQGNAPGDPVTLDEFGHGAFSCDIPINLRGSTAGLQIQPNIGPPIVVENIPVN